MITQYYRPNTIEEALKYLSLPNTFPLGGGTVLSRQTERTYSVVDLQSLGLDELHTTNNNLQIGATVTLQKLLESTHTPDSVKYVIYREAPLNLRTMSTVVGAIVTSDGRSPFSVTMLALDTKCLLVGENSLMISLGDLLPLRNEIIRGKLVTRIEIPLNIRSSFEAVARTPSDKPILCAALAKWPSGRIRLALGGWGREAKLAFDGNDLYGLEDAARSVVSDAGDEWASSDYRMDVIGILIRRCMDKLKDRT
jgi:CO/xanthine dehydrogenase FAD-binding subunit